MPELECPVDFVTVNENKVRFVALFVFLLSTTFLIVSNWFIPLVLTVDFYFRGFKGGKYSLLLWLAGIAEKSIPLHNKPTDRGPKRFAAQIGFCFSFLVFLFSIAGWRTPAFATASILVVFSFLKSALGFCAGCYVYTYVSKYLVRK